MYRIVFGTGVSLEIAVVITLHTQHGLHTKYRIQIRILTAGLLATTPTRITARFWKARAFARLFVTIVSLCFVL